MYTEVFFVFFLIIIIVFYIQNHISDSVTHFFSPVLEITDDHYLNTIIKRLSLYLDASLFLISKPDVES